MKKYVCSICSRPISAKRNRRNKLCVDCSLERFRSWVTAMREKSGPKYDLWKARWEAATGMKIKESE